MVSSVLWSVCLAEFFSNMVLREPGFHHRSDQSLTRRTSQWCSFLCSSLLRALCPCEQGQHSAIQLELVLFHQGWCLSGRDAA